MNQDWAPNSTDDRTMRDAVSLLRTSINGAVPNVDNDKFPSRFILSSNGFFGIQHLPLTRREEAIVLMLSDLRAYIMSGKEFPKTESEFEALIPAKTLAAITIFDRDVYPQTKRTLVGIGSSCNEYYSNQLARLVNAAAAAIHYADNTTHFLTVAEGMNLRHHLNILLQEKYKSKEDQDNAFVESKEAALMVLQILKEDANEKKKEIDNIIAKLITHRTTTLALQPGVALLTQKFKTGPVENSSNDPNKKKPYLDQLAGQYNNKLKELEAQLEKARKKNDRWELSAAGAIGLALFPGFGWVLMGPLALKAVDLRNAYKKLMMTFNEGNKENAETLRVVSNITTMINQCTDIDKKMTNAIKAMEELSLLFGHHSTCYDKIAFYLNSTSIGVKSDSGTNRRLFINSNLEQTTKWLADLKSTAQEFQLNIIREVHMN